MPKPKDKLLFETKYKPKILLNWVPCSRRSPRTLLSIYMVTLDDVINMDNPVNHVALLRLQAKDNDYDLFED